jgi:hypothetical protein
MNKLFKRSLLAIGMATAVVAFNALNEVYSKDHKDKIKSEKE